MAFVGVSIGEVLSALTAFQSIEKLPFVGLDFGGGLFAEYGQGPFSGLFVVEPVSSVLDGVV